MNRPDLQCKVQIERWEGSVLEINAIFADLGQKCLQLLFVCFVALRPKSTAIVIAGRSVHLTTLFPGQA